MAGLFFVAVAQAAFEPLTLNDKTFNKMIAKIPLAFLLAGKADNVYTEQIMPLWKSVGEALHNDIQFVYIDYNDSQKVREKQNITSFPSFYVYRHGVKTTEYNGEKDLPSIAKYIKRITGPPFVEIDNARDANDFLDDARFSVILAGEDLDASMLKTFKQVASNLMDIAQFAIATTTDAVQQLEIEETPSIQIHRADDRAVIDFPIAFGVDVKKLTQWIQENMAPKYMLRDGNTFRNLIQDPRYTILSIVDTTKPRSMNTVHSVFGKLTEEFGENFTYVYTDLYDFGQNTLYLGFSGAREPLFTICFFAGTITEKYLFPERKEPTPANVAAWVEDFNAGKLQPKLRSEPVPGESTTAAKKLVATQFQKITRDPDHDVLVLLHESQEKTNPEPFELLEKVAEEFLKQKVETVKFYHFNTALNDLHGLQLPPGIEMPLFIYFPAGDEKQPLRLPQDLTTETLISIVLTHSKSKPQFEMPEQADEGSLEL